MESRLWSLAVEFTQVLRYHAVRDKVVIDARCDLVIKFRMRPRVKIEARPRGVLEPDDLGGMLRTVRHPD